MPKHIGKEISVWFGIHGVVHKSLLVEVMLQSRNINVYFKIAITKIKTYTNMILKQLGKNDYQNASVGTLEKVNSLPWNPIWAALPAAQLLDQLRLHPPALTIAVLTQYAVSGKGTISSLFSPACARGPSWVFEYKFVPCIFFWKMYVYPNENFYSDI